MFTIKTDLGDYIITIMSLNKPIVFHNFTTKSIFENDFYDERVKNTQHIKGKATDEREPNFHLLPWDELHLLSSNEVGNRKKFLEKLNGYKYYWMDNNH